MTELAMEFFCGTDTPCWLADEQRPPLFVSIRRLRQIKKWPRASGPWALDSGGFTELDSRGRWEVPPHRYAAETSRARDEIGHLAWAAPQDWMCEPVIRAKTGLTVAEHQQRTVDNWLALSTLLPGVFVPVLQGWDPDDYLRHHDLYASRGVDLASFPTVGLGTVCRRQDTATAAGIVGRLADRGLRLHGFGIKTTGIAQYGDLLTSADSMAWSYAARVRPIRLPGCAHAKCNHCRIWAYQWAASVKKSQPDHSGQYNPFNWST